MAEYREFKDGELIAGTRYQVQRLIGVGGMGTVYEVEHVELGKRFVLKALLRELSRREDLVIRLRNEWRALGRLEHPSIVTVTDAGTSATGVPFYVMERLEGETLSMRMRRTRRFPVREAVEIAAGVLEGLAAAHQIGVVHRDVKPPNIFLVGEGKPKVLDFGVAKIADDPGVVTARGIAVGTPRYMSPEQARGEHVDGRADVYSTGLILFEMITGVSPFEEARDANELILAHLVRRPPALSSLTMGVPPELDAAVACMLEKKRDDRPPSALDAARRLRDISAQMAPPEASGRYPSLPPPAARLSSQPPPKPRISAPPSSGPNDVTLLPVEGVHHTTRPDGVASRRSTLTSGSMTGDILAGDPCPEGQRTFGRSSAVPDTLFSPPSFAAPNFAFDATQPAPAPSQRFRAPPASVRPQSQSGEHVRTEVLTAVPQADAAPTRTRYPSPTLSETPPPVTPTPEPGVNPFRPKSQRIGLIALGVGAAALMIVGVVSLLRSGPSRESNQDHANAPSPGDARPASQPSKEADVHALRPAAGPALPHTSAPARTTPASTAPATSAAPKLTAGAAGTPATQPPEPSAAALASRASAKSERTPRHSAAARPSAAPTPTPAAVPSAGRPAQGSSAAVKAEHPSLPSSGL